MTPQDIIKSVQLASDIAKPGLLPILSNLVIGNNKIISSDVDSQITIAAPFDFPAYTVPAAKFKGILATLSDAPLTLTHKDGKLTVKSGRSKFGIQTLPADDFPMMALEHPVMTINLDQVTLKSMLQDVQHASAINSVKPYLNGVLLEQSQGSLNCVATDAYRLAMRSIPTDGPDMQIIIPRNAVGRLIKLLGDGVAIASIYEDRAVFTIGDIEFITKMIPGKYPDYRRVIQKSAHKILLDREIFVEAINRAAVVLDKVRSCKVSIGQVIGVTCSNAGETASDEFESAWDGQALEIGLNPDYLRDALSAVGGDEITFGFTDAKSAVTIEGNGMVAVVQQMRV